MEATKPYKVIVFGAVEATKTCRFIWFGPWMPPNLYFIAFGAVDATKTCRFIWFGAIEATKPYKFIGFGAVGATKTCRFIRFGPWIPPNL